MNLSFAGCGFLGIYHVGVACCFKKYAPHLLLNKISGASAGSIAACCLILDLPLGEMTSDVLRVAIEARRRSLGPFNPSFNIHNLLLEGLEKFLPDDAHIKVSGKLHISLTRVHDGKNVIVSQFDTRDELIQVLLASSFIPIFSGIIPPKFKGIRYMDGGYSDNLPTLDENTITVSPFCGESDICPRDDSSQLFHINIANTSIELSKHNIYRIVRILFPPEPEVLSNMCKQGFDDALRFLHKNNLISCTRCLAVQSTFVVSEANDESLEFDPQCDECLLHRQEALVSNMPETVLNIFQEAIDSANKGLLNWAFKYRGMKLLSVLSLPYTLPVDMMYATITKLGVIPAVQSAPKVILRKVTDLDIISAVGNQFERRSLQMRFLRGGAVLTKELDRRIVYKSNDMRMMSAAPQLGNGVWELSKYCLNQMSQVLTNVNKRREQLSAKIICQLAITEYGKDDDAESCHELSTKNKMNLNFTLNLDDRDLPLDQSPARKFGSTTMLKRTPSLTVNKTDTGDNDTFEHVLQVTSQHDAIMAYYYLDENNKVKVTEIFDVTDSDSPLVQSGNEKELNQKLEFDDGWDQEATTWMANIEELDFTERRESFGASSEYSFEDMLNEKDSSPLFSDPESEWQGSYKVEEPEDPEDTLRPECEQPNFSSINEKLKNHEVPSFTFDADYKTH